MADFKLTEREIVAGQREVRIEGEFDRAVAADLEGALARAATCDTLLIDLSECEFMDSVGVSLLVRARRELEPGARLQVDGAKGQVQRILTLTGVLVTAPA